MGDEMGFIHPSNSPNLSLTVTVPGLITSTFHDHQPYYLLTRIY